jgi:hypothetical protein
MHDVPARADDLTFEHSLFQASTRVGETRARYKGREIVVRTGAGGSTATVEIDGKPIEIDGEPGRYTSRLFFQYYATPLDLAKAVIDTGLV